MYISKFSYLITSDDVLDECTGSYINKSKINIHAHQYHALLLSYNLALLQFKNTFQNLIVFSSITI